MTNAKSKADEATSADEQPDTLATEVGHFSADQLYGDHLNQKFGNVPASPKTGPGMMEPGDERMDETNSVLMAHKTNNLDGVGSAFVRVDKGMVGDYARAGWHVADLSDTAGGGDDVGPGTGPTDDAAGEKATKLTEEVGSSQKKADEK